jgi:hypothetical protein
VAQISLFLLEKFADVPDFQGVISSVFRIVAKILTDFGISLLLP